MEGVMKKSLLVVITVLFSAILLTSCINNGETNSDNSGNSNGGNPNSLVLKKFSEFFNTTVTAKYNDRVTQVLDHTGQYESFTSLLDRQIEVLAQDLLFRLFITYGKQDNTQWLPTNYTNHNQKAYLITENIIGNGNYKSSGNYALIDTHSIIIKPEAYNYDYPKYILSNGEDVTKYTHIAQYHINEVAPYASIFYLGVWRPSLMDSLFSFEDSIDGYYGVGYTSGYNLYRTQDINIAWQWDYNGASIDLMDTTIDAFSKYLDAYKQPFKTAIANILAINYHTGLDYITALEKIGHLGYRDVDKVNILNFVQNEIIGESQFSSDKDYKPDFDILSSLNYNTITDYNRRYKAYSIIVPSIVETAFNNTFYGTNTSLYVERSSRFEEKQNGIVYTSLGDLNYSSILIKPSKQINLTKLELTINGVNRTQINSVKYSVYSSSSNLIASNLLATIGDSTFDSSTHKITIDLSKLNTKTIDSNGYITIYFDIDISIMFSVTIDGYFS